MIPITKCLHYGTMTCSKSEIIFTYILILCLDFLPACRFYDFMTDMFTQVGNKFQALINYNSQLQRLSIESSDENRDF